MVEPKYRNLFKTGNFTDDMRGTSLHLQLIVFPVIVSYNPFDTLILYVADVLVGTQSSPDPDLLLNLMALWVIIFFGCVGDSSDVQE